METVMNFVNTVINSQLFLLTLTVLVYMGAQRLYARFHSVLLNPILVAAAVIIAVLKLGKVEFETYYEANALINFMLGFSVVSLGYLMYTNMSYIKSFRYSIIFSTIIGSIIGVGSVIAMAYLFGYDHVISASIQPKSVTMPIALGLSEVGSGIPAITSLAVIIAGVFGNVVGVKVLALVGVTDSVARGLALGSASHTVGTARAMELGAVEGAVGGAAIGLMGVMTSLVMPIINALL